MRTQILLLSMLALGACARAPLRPAPGGVATFSPVPTSYPTPNVTAVPTPIASPTPVQAYDRTGQHVIDVASLPISLQGQQGDDRLSVSVDATGYGYVHRVNAQGLAYGVPLIDGSFTNGSDTVLPPSILKFAKLVRTDTNELQLVYFQSGNPGWVYRWSLKNVAAGNAAFHFRAHAEGLLYGRYGDRIAVNDIQEINSGGLQVTLNSGRKLLWMSFPNTWAQNDTGNVPPQNGVGIVLDPADHPVKIDVKHLGSTYHVWINRGAWTYLLRDIDGAAAGRPVWEGVLQNAGGGILRPDILRFAAGSSKIVPNDVGALVLAQGGPAGSAGWVMVISLRDLGSPGFRPTSVYEEALRGANGEVIPVNSLTAFGGRESLPGVVGAVGNRELAWRLENSFLAITDSALPSLLKPIWEAQKANTVDAITHYTYKDGLRWAHWDWLVNGGSPLEASWNRTDVNGTGVPFRVFAPTDGACLPGTTAIYESSFPIEQVGLVFRYERLDQHQQALRDQWTDRGLQWCSVPCTTAGALEVYTMLDLTTAARKVTLGALPQERYSTPGGTGWCAMAP